MANLITPSAVKAYEVQDVADIDFDQITITASKDMETGAVEVRVRANVAVSMINPADPSDLQLYNLPINLTEKELGLGAEIATIRAAVLTQAKIKLSGQIK
jgi:hypothetical protein